MNLPPPDFEGTPLPKPAPPPVPDPNPAPIVLEGRPPEPPPFTGPTHPAKQKEPTVELDPDSMGSLLRDALTYPWRRDGWMIVIPGAVMAGILTIASYASLLGTISVILGACYFAAYYFDVIETTLTGRDHPPEWPAISDFIDDILRPGIRMVGVALLSTMPLIIIAAMGGDNTDETSRRFGLLIGYLIYWAYLPMATLATVYNGTLSAALPHRVIPAIASSMPGYLLGVGALAAGELIQQSLSAVLGAIPIIGIFIPFLIYFYALVVQARLTGTLFLRYQNRIGW